LTNYANRGRWLESAVIATNLIYAQRGLACVTKVSVPVIMPRGSDPIRLRSTVDFQGVAGGIAVAFDCKLTKKARLPAANVKPHQLEYLHSFIVNGGVGFLLVCFEGKVTGTFAVTPVWWTQALAKASSVSVAAFLQSTGMPGSLCVRVQHGDAGAPVHYLPAIKALAGVAV